MTSYPALRERDGQVPERAEVGEQAVALGVEPPRRRSTSERASSSEGSGRTRWTLWTFGSSSTKRESPIVAAFGARISAGTWHSASA